MGGRDALLRHLSTGVTTVCRCWKLLRKDGLSLGFTDHDADLAFDGTIFRAGDGLSARAFDQTTGLAVDNTEALGILSASGISEQDIKAGRFDGADVLSWMVNWQDPSQRSLQFRGSIGEIQYAGGAFRAELRGLTESLNQPLGAVYQAPCSAILGDERCGVDLQDARWSIEIPVLGTESEKRFRVGGLRDYPDGWFERGRLAVLTGTSAGAVAVVKADRSTTGTRIIEVWEAFAENIAVGTVVRLEAGCDKRAETCRTKFRNMANFRGFPHLPGEDWLMAYPKSSGRNTGGSLGE